MNGSLIWSATSRPVQSPRDSRYFRISASTSLSLKSRIANRRRIDRHELIGRLLGILRRLPPIQRRLPADGSRWRNGRRLQPMSPPRAHRSP